MTQTALAERAGVSQSFVAKLEAGEISPGYEKVQRLEAVLDEDVPTIGSYVEPAVTCHPDTPAREVVATVVQEGYVIVVRDGVQQGVILPTHLLSYTAGDLRGRTAEGMMEGSLPELSPHMTEAALRSLLSVSPVVAVVAEGELAGAISRDAVLGRLMEDI